ncbi:MAG: asparaginase [Actinobacteria bacterium]|nr:asparaginase [Actinomycetota bacterium]
MSDAIRVTARRGGIVESAHRVHAVAVQDGAVVAEAGDGALVTFMRSAAKPLQALPLAVARDDLESEQIAIASASHLAAEEQLEAVRSLLALARAHEDELECGPPPGGPPRRILHNCSGKHAGMLALCRTRAWPSVGYRLAEHPLQRELLAGLADAAEIPADGIGTAVDGCGVVTFALPLERMAFVFSRLERLEGGAKVAAAMRAHPTLIRGEGAPDTLLMQKLAGWTAKGGAEGLHCALGPGGLGIAMKVEDGNQRAVKPALVAFLSVLGFELEELARPPLLNSRGERVGELAAEPL